VTTPRRPVALALALTLAVIMATGISGCAIGPAHQHPSHTTASPPTPAPTAEGTPSAKPSGVIGTTSFRSADGELSGTVTITATGNRTGSMSLIDVTVSNYHSTEPMAGALELSPYPAGTHCLSDQFSLSLGNMSDAATQTFRFGVDSDASDPDPTDGDPTLYRTVVAGAPEASAPSGGCVLQPLAEGSVTWTIPHPASIFAVRDSGPETDAMGATTMAAGKPVSYQVAENDTILAVAKRFRVSVDALLYLDPTADLPNPWSTLPAGETITLIRSTS
jgi:hypothetical protein